MLNQVVHDKLPDTANDRTYEGVQAVLEDFHGKMIAQLQEHIADAMARPLADEDIVTNQLEFNDEGKVIAGAGERVHNTTYKWTQADKDKTVARLQLSLARAQALSSPTDMTNLDIKTATAGHRYAGALLTQLGLLEIVFVSKNGLFIQSLN